jgi:hypothetical protein
MCIHRILVGKQSCRKALEAYFANPSFSGFGYYEMETYSASFIWYSKSNWLEGWSRNFLRAGL